MQTESTKDKAPLPQAQALNETTLADRLAEGAWCLQAGLLERALEVYEQALALDPRRRDVTARIHWIEQEQARRGRVRQNRWVLGLSLFVVAALAAFVTARESQFEERLDALPVIEEGVPHSVRVRLDAMNDLLGEPGVWLGAGRLRHERDRLQVAYDAREAARKRQGEAADQQLRDQDQSARRLMARALQCIGRGQFEKAREFFGRARDLLPAGSDLSNQVAVELHALARLTAGVVDPDSDSPLNQHSEEALKK